MTIFPFGPPPPSKVSKASPLWKDFEQDVADHIASRFAGVKVTHNATLPGVVSKRDRQIDVLVEGTLGGSDIRLVVECKRYATRTLKIGTVDAFAGKLQDVGAELGVLWSFSGFDVGATARAKGAINPRIELRTWQDFEDHREINDEFFSAADCPNDECWGEVGWHTVEGDESKRALEVGHCDQCGTLAGRCPECEEITSLDSSANQCWGCDAEWTVLGTHHGDQHIDWSSEPSSS